MRGPFTKGCVVGRLLVCGSSSGSCARSTCCCLGALWWCTSCLSPHFCSWLTLWLGWRRCVGGAGQGLWRPPAVFGSGSATTYPMPYILGPWPGMWVTRWGPWWRSRESWLIPQISLCLCFRHWNITVVDMPRALTEVRSMGGSAPSPEHVHYVTFAMATPSFPPVLIPSSPPFTSPPVWVSFFATYNLGALLFTLLLIRSSQPHVAVSCGARLFPRKRLS